MTAQAIRHLNDGIASGMQHDFLDPLCAENIRKARMADANTSPSVSAYWTGYLIGLASNNQTDLFLELQRESRIPDSLL